MGLLDFLNTDEGRLGLGLLAAAGPRRDGMGAGGRIQEAFAGADARKRAKAEEEWKKMQMEEARAQMAQRQQAAMRDQQMQAAWQRAQTQGQPGLSPLMGDPSAGILPSQGRAAVPAGFNAQQFANEAGGIDWKQGMALQQALQKQTPKFSTAPQYDQQGRAFILAEDGSMKYLDGVMARDKLNEVRLGDKVGFRTDYSPELRGTIPIGQSPDSRMSNQVTMRGQDMTDSRARDLNAIAQQGNAIKLGEKSDEKNLAKAGQVASFDVMLSSLDRLSKHPGLGRSVGVIGAFPTMPGSESANFKAELDTFQSQAFLPMVSQLKGMGALSDAEGKKLTAAVGALNPAMGEKAFRESVARITNDMASARGRLTGENRVGATGGWDDKPKPTQAPQAAVNMLKMNPKLAAAYDEKYGAGAAAQVLGR